MEATLTETPQQTLKRVEFEMAKLGYRTDARHDEQASIVMSAKMRQGFWGWFWNIVILLGTFGLGLVWIFIQSFIRVRVTIRAVQEAEDIKLYCEGNAQAVKDAQKVDARTRP